MNFITKGIPILALGGGLLAYNSIFYVSAGENGILFNYLTGKFTNKTYREGYHLRIPIVSTPIIYET